MSYEIVKGIKIKDDKVFVKSASNNVCPKSYEWYESGYLTNILREKGKNAVEIEILRGYDEGNLQAGTKNRYTRALKILRHFDEYKNFDWRTNKEIDQEGYGELLLRALNSELPKEKYMIVKRIDERLVYFYHRRKSGFCKWYDEKKRASIFDFKEDAELTKKWFTNSENWEVVLA